MKSYFTIDIKHWKQRLLIFSLLIFIAIFSTACGLAPKFWQNLFHSQEATPTSTEFTISLEVQALNPTEEDIGEKITSSPSSSKNEITTPSVEPSYTASPTITVSLTPSITFTNTFVFVPPTFTKIPPTSTKVPVSNSPIPPSATPEPTETEVTEPPTQEPTEEPTIEPTEEPTEAPVCYTLTLSHVGQGTDPFADPKYSQGCPIDQYTAGQIIKLNRAIPDANWEIDGWTGTLSNSSTADNNRVKMPEGDHTAKVIYGRCG